MKTETTVTTIKAEVETITKEIESLNLMINVAKRAGNSNVIIKYMKQQDVLSTQLAELKHKLLFLKC